MKREGDGFFVQYALFDTLSSNSRWVYRGQSTVGNLPKLRLDVVRGILTAVGSPAEDASSRLLLVPSVIRPAAYEAFLRGTFALRNPDRYPPAFAADCFAEALLIDSAFAQAHAAYGWATMLANEAAAEPTQAATAHALASVQAAMRLGWTTSETFRVWGMAEFFRGQYQKARERFEEAVATSPSDAEAQRRLAYACVATGRYEAAVQAAQTAVQNDPGNAASHATLGNVYQFLGQYVHAGIGKGSESREALSSAVRAYEQGIRFAPDRSAYASGLYAEAMVYVQRADRSVELMSDRVARTRTSAVDLYRLARVEQAAGRPRTQWVETLGRARSLVEEELRSEPGDPEALSVLALIQTRLGQFREAQEAIRTALQVEPGNVTVMLNGGRVYALQREKVRALDLLRRALSRKYSLPDILDMDLYNLRSEEGFLAAVTA
jgi:tetratricopeptide (TPR) repeat protein